MAEAYRDMREGVCSASSFMTYEDIEDILGRDVVRRLERSLDEGRAAAAAAYSENGSAALEALMLLHLVSILTSFPGGADAVCRAEYVGSLLKHLVADVMTARTKVPSVLDLPLASYRGLIS